MTKAEGSEPEEEKEKRKAMIEEEMEKVIKDTQEYVEVNLEEEFEPEAIEALRKAARKMAYTKKFYDVMKDEIVFFPSVQGLIMKNSLQDEAEKYYWEEEDEFPLEYTKALKTVVREQGYKFDDNEENIDNDAYMEKFAQDVEI
jgi:hypothetical protein